MRPDGVRRITGTCAKDGARSCKDRSRMRPRDDYGNYVAQRYFVPPQPAFVAMGTDRQMNLSSDRSDHPASWRSGGASTAELAALTAFAADPSLRVIGTTSVKQFGEQRKPPPGAAVHFRGNDSDDGPLLKYTVITWALRHTKIDNRNNSFGCFRRRPSKLWATLDSSMHGRNCRQLPHIPYAWPLGFARARPLAYLPYPLRLHP